MEKENKNTPPEKQTGVIPLPWNRASWKNIKAKLTKPLVSIVDFENLLASLDPSAGILRRHIVDLFTAYAYDDRCQAKFKPEEVLAILNNICAMAAAGPILFKGRVLTRLTDGNIILTRKQAACLLACGWLGLIDCGIRKIIKESRMFSIQCLLGYFHVAATAAPEEVIIYDVKSPQVVDWEASEQKICDLSVLDGCDIDSVDGYVLLDSDVATFSPHHMSQQNITYSVRPECMLLPWLTRSPRPERKGRKRDGKKPADDPAPIPQCIYTIYGTAKYVSYDILGDTRVYSGWHPDTSPVAEIELRGNKAVRLRTGRMYQNCILHTFTLSVTLRQAEKKLFEPDLNIIYSAVVGADQVTSTDWNDYQYSYRMSLRYIHIKFIQMLLACSAAGVPMIHAPRKINDESIVNLANVAYTRALSVRDFYKAYKEVIADIDNDDDLLLALVEYIDYM